MHNTDKILIYTDASFRDTVGGWSCIFVHNHKIKKIEGFTPKYVQDSGTAEFYAVMKAIEHIRHYYPKINKISVNTDHQGIISSFSKYYKSLKNDENAIIYGKSSNRMIKKWILHQLKIMNAFMSINFIESHQIINKPSLKKLIKQLKNKNDTLFMSNRIKWHKNTYWEKVRQNKNKKRKDFNEEKKLAYDYIQLKKAGTNRSAILNNFADIFSRKMRRKAQRMNRY